MVIESIAVKSQDENFLCSIVLVLFCCSFFFEQHFYFLQHMQLNTTPKRNILSLTINLDTFLTVLVCNHFHHTVQPVFRVSNKVISFGN